MRGKINGFTLIELLIAVVISTFVALALAGVYRSVQDVRERFITYEQNRKLYELIYLIQKQLTNCKSLELDGNTLSYYTTFGISAPYVMVRLQVLGRLITYSESNPYDPSVIYLKRELHSPYDFTLKLGKDRRSVMLSTGKTTIDLYVSYNKVPTSSIFLKPF